MATIAENLQTIIDIKADIKTAIENKGVTVGDAAFSEYAGKIDSIEGSGTANVILPDGIKLGNTKNIIWPTNIKFSASDNWRTFLYGTTGITNLPAIDITKNGVGSSDLYGLFSSATINLDDNTNFWNSIIENTEYISDIKNMFRYATISGLILSTFVIESNSITSLDNLFRGCDMQSPLTSISINCENCKDCNMAFTFDNEITGFTSLNLSNLGTTFTNTSYSSNYHTLDISKLNFTNPENLVDTFNSLADVNNIVDDATIIINTSNSSSLTNEQIAIATSKGWTVQSA